MSEEVRCDLYCIECGKPVEEAFYDEDVDVWEGFCLPCAGVHVAVTKQWLEERREG